MAYDRLEKSCVLLGRPGTIASAEEFPISNVMIDADRYSYEGNWLFCTFTQSDIVAARIGFGRGKMDWRDYGIESAPISANALFSRIEVITSQGIYAYFSSDPDAGKALASSSTGLDLRLRNGQQDLIRISGWPVMHWQFQNPEGTLTTDLTVQIKQMTVWPDFVMPNNTFAVSVGSAVVSGSVCIEGETQFVVGTVVFDHPRIVVQPNAVAPFGWYLYAPIQFSNGIQLACYYSEDGSGQRDDIYSAGMLVWKDGNSRWLAECQVSNLKLDSDSQPVQWETQLRSDGCSASFSAKIRQLPLVRGWGDADPSRTQGKYVAYPLLMEVEGEGVFESQQVRLEQGRGIAEFLVRKGFQPTYP
ncbi:MAG: hypothetical protein FJW26_01625 [Acidimicrobiia bacterium]|nr:hypothetical protein [Acidimicrobiia bacterium]